MIPSFTLPYHAPTLSVLLICDVARTSLTSSLTGFHVNEEGYAQ